MGKWGSSAPYGQIGTAQGHQGCHSQDAQTGENICFALRACKVEALRPISASMNTATAPPNHRSRRKRRHGSGIRLSAAAITPPTTKATAAIAHQGPALRNCMAREEERFCHSPRRSNPALLSWICSASAASTPQVRRSRKPALERARDPPVVAWDWASALRLSRKPTPGPKPGRNSERCKLHSLIRAVSRGVRLARRPRRYRFRRSRNRPRS